MTESVCVSQSTPPTAQNNTNNKHEHDKTAERNAERSAGPIHLGFLAAVLITVPKMVLVAVLKAAPKMVLVAVLATTSPEEPAEKHPS